MIFYMQFYIKGSTWREPQISKKYLSQTRNVFLGILRGPSGPRRAPGANHFLHQFFHLLSLDSKLYFLSQLFFGRKSSVLSFSTKQSSCTLACFKTPSLCYCKSTIALPNHATIFTCPLFLLRFQLLEIFWIKRVKCSGNFLGSRH